MKTNFFLTALMVLVIAVAGIIAFGGPSKAQGLNESDYTLYDINKDGCILRIEVDTIVSLLAPEATTIVDETNFVVFTAPNQTTDMAVEFGEDGCATASTLLPKDTNA